MSFQHYTALLHTQVYLTLHISNALLIYETVHNLKASLKIVTQMNTILINLCSIVPGNI